MIRTLAVNCTPFCDCSKHDRKTALETASADMVMGAVQALGESSLLVSQYNRTALSLTVLDQVLKYFTRRIVQLKNTICQCLRRPRWMNSWQQNPISQKNIRLIKFVLPWRFKCVEWKRFQQHIDCYFRRAYIGPDNALPKCSHAVQQTEKS